VKRLGHPADYLRRTADAPTPQISRRRSRRPCALCSRSVCQWREHNACAVRAQGEELWTLQGQKEYQEEQDNETSEADETDEAVHEVGPLNPAPCGTGTKILWIFLKKRQETPAAKKEDKNMGSIANTLNSINSSLLSEISSPSIT
jgi:hypothetical protein